jgi:Ca-activated chloride channel family protein
MIAQETGGEFFPAYSAQQLEGVYDEINRLEKSELKGEQFLQKSYYYIYFLFVSFMSLLLYLVIRSKKGWS